MTRDKAKAFTSIVFDLDGTLLDTAPDVHLCSNLALRAMGLPEISLAQARASIGPGPDNFARVTLGEENMHRFGEFIALFRQLYSDRCLVSTRPFPGVMDMLQSLQGHRLVVATNKPGPYTKRILAGLNMEPYFDVVICPEEVTHLKPHPEMILTAMARTAATPETTLVVGDTDNDIIAGKAAGARTCAVTWGYGPRATLESLGPDFVISRAAELFSLLRRRQGGDDIRQRD
ncbi:MAG: HAD-IA family hydrolase [bacterium]|jgi:phosphoglycolate phosphatase|nr:HAD-IA family hydrolase [candidate division KSB1 bacterium]MDH7561690.1 HAD-IA family hydrolase [bacterium]